MPGEVKHQRQETAPEDEHNELVDAVGGRVDGPVGFRSDMTREASLQAFCSI
jgi:hypothetical protein